MIILLPNEGIDSMDTFAKASIEDLTKLAKGEMYPTNFFSAIVDNGLSMNKAQQCAKIIVDEKGTLAVVVSVSSAGFTSAGPPQNPEFFVDHPFAFAIAERSTGVFLFAGVVRRMN